MAVETWQIDPVHSFLRFTIRHFVVSKVHGRFTQWGGTIHFDNQQPTNSKVEIQIDANSIDTGDGRRDGHLKTADFFDTEKHPQITFRSTKIESAGPNRYRVTGDLTIRGVAKPVTLEVEHGGEVKDPWGNQRGGFSIQGSFDRRDFGLTFNQTLEGGGPALGDKIELVADVEATKAAAQAA
ncbi:MAG TPA: YceI family protein [Bryobacteraceae bacterium]|nr:YceI family protein [Bryobacteraceae bacterium]